MLKKQKDEAEECIKVQVGKMKKKLFPLHLELIIEVLCKKLEILANSISRNLYSQPSLINCIIADIKDPWNEMTMGKNEYME